MVELPEGAIVELELGIYKKPTKIRVIEAEQINKYLYNNSHKRDDLGSLV